MLYTSTHTGEQIDSILDNSLSTASAAATYLTQASAANTYAPLTGVGTSGTWPINISGNATYSPCSTKIYASDSPYRYGDTAPYYAYFTYNDYGDNTWYLRVNPATPADIRVAKSYTSVFSTYIKSIWSYPTNQLSQGTLSSNLFANGNILHHGFMENGPSGYSSVLYWSGYDKWGGVELAPTYNANAPGLYMRVFLQGGSGDSGGGWGTWSSFTKTAASSIKLKENIHNITDEDGLKILQTRPVTFDYKPGKGDKDQIGFIAEELDELLPQTVTHAKLPTEDDPAMYVDFTKFVPYMVKLLQIQDKEIQSLKSEINELKQIIANKE